MEFFFHLLLALDFILLKEFDMISGIRHYSQYTSKLLTNTITWSYTNTITYHDTIPSSHIYVQFELSVIGFAIPAQISYWHTECRLPWHMASFYKCENSIMKMKI